MQSFYNEIVWNSGDSLISDTEYIKEVVKIAYPYYDEDEVNAIVDNTIKTHSERFHPYSVYNFYLAYADDKDAKLVYDLIREKTGLPALYSYSNLRSDFRELSSTYREEPIELRKFRVQQGTPAQRNVYTQLTQLAFDSGKMGYNEYKQIMGENFCQKPNCCDMKCKIYKLGCTGAC